MMEKNKLIQSKLLEAAQHVHEMGFAPAYISLHGSQNYGLSLETNEYTSDYDFKCMVLPSLWELVKSSKPVSRTIDVPGGQIDIKDVRVYTESMLKMNMGYMECLLTPHYAVLPGGENMEKMRALLGQLAIERAAQFARMCRGMFLEKEKNLCHPFPAVLEKIEKYGYDGKQAHHMYRLLTILRHFDAAGEVRIAAPEEEKELLLSLKLNRYPLEKARSLIAQWKPEMDALCAHIEGVYGEAKEETAQLCRSLMQSMVYDHIRRGG